MKAEIKSLEESFGQKVASMVASIKNHVDGGEVSDAETNEEFERDAEKIEKRVLAFGDNGLKNTQISRTRRACGSTNHMTLFAGSCLYCFSDDDGNCQAQC